MKESRHENEDDEDEDEREDEEDFSRGLQTKCRDDRDPSQLSHFSHSILFIAYNHGHHY